MSDKNSNLDPNVEEMVSFIDDMQPTTSALYLKLKRDGLDESEILDEILEMVTRSIGVIDEHNIGEKKIQQYLTWVTERVAKELFFQAREDALK